MAASWKSTAISAPGHPSVLTRRVGYLLRKTEEKDSLMALTSTSGQTVIYLILLLPLSQHGASEADKLPLKRPSRAQLLHMF